MKKTDSLKVQGLMTDGHIASVFLGSGPSTGESSIYLSRRKKEASDPDTKPPARRQTVAPKVDNDPKPKGIKVSDILSGMKVIGGDPGVRRPVNSLSNDDTQTIGMSNAEWRLSINYDKGKAAGERHKAKYWKKHNGLKIGDTSETTGKTIRHGQHVPSHNNKRIFVNV